MSNGAAVSAPWFWPGCWPLAARRPRRPRGGGATIAALEHDAHWTALATDMLRRDARVEVAHRAHSRWRRPRLCIVAGFYRYAVKDDRSTMVSRVPNN